MQYIVIVHCSGGFRGVSDISIETRFVLDIQIHNLLNNNSQLAEQQAKIHYIIHTSVVQVRVHV